MKPWKCLAVMIVVLFCGCGREEPLQRTAPTTAVTETVTETVTEAVTEAVTLPATTAPAPLHSPLYIPGISVEDVITYFNEVCLDAEIINSGNPSLLQKWSQPICYTIHGAYTQEDLQIFTEYLQWLNTIEGFPGIMEASDPLYTNLDIHFCTQTDMLSLMGDHFIGTDGAVTFWYDNNAIYNAIICYRTELDQQTRNSVILEEIYNGLGPIQDTSLRPDSIIYSGFSTPQELTEIDQLLLKLLYHPDMQCGMNAADCETIIRQLYY